MIVEQAVGSTNGSLAVALRVPGDAYARLEIVLVSLNPFLQAKNVIAGFCQSDRRLKLGRNFYVVAQTIIKSEIGFDAP